MTERSPLEVPFVEMADRIARNAGDGFSGAFVVVTPDGTQKSLLILDNTQSVAQFWGALMTTAQIALAEIENEERQSSLYGRR